MPYALVVLLLAVALGQGGYAPWATFALELGTVSLALWVVLEVLWSSRPADRDRFLQQQRVRKRLPFLARHPALGRLLHRLSLGRFPRRSAFLEVDIFPPGSQDSEPISDFWLIQGYAFRRTGLGVPLLCFTLWIVLSLVPWSNDSLATLSPRAGAVRSEAESLLASELPRSALTCWSLTPFLTLRSFWLWLSYLGLFYVSFYLARNRERVQVLARLLLLLGVGFGAYGMTQWVLGVQQLLQDGAQAARPLARASFDNRNHYAAFMEMLLLCGLGWLGSRWVSVPSRRGGCSREMTRVVQEVRARLSLAGLGIVILSLGLVFSLSRSGITFALAGCSAFAFLTRRITEPPADPQGPLDLPQRRNAGSRGKRAGRIYVAVILIVLGTTVWMGIEPVIARFEMLPGDWNAEMGRWQVWADSAAATRDFWLTGAGLSSFRYVFPTYRSFSGRVSYSWAHNDYLQLLFELGIPGLLLLLWIMFRVAIDGGRVRASLSRHPSLGLLHSGYCAAALAIGLHSFTDFSLHMPANAALLSVIVAVIVGMR